MNWVGENGLLLFVIWGFSLCGSRVVCKAKSKSCRDGGRNFISLGLPSSIRF